MLHAAAETVCVAPEVGSPGQSLTHAKVGEVFSPIKTTLTLLKSNRVAVCVIATHFLVEHQCLTNLYRKRVARELNLSPEQVFVFSSHNHTEERSK